MAKLSEDRARPPAGTAYDVTPDAGMVAPFKNLALRLEVGEVGVVKTQFGIHSIQRTEGPPGVRIATRRGSGNRRFKRAPPPDTD